MLIVKCMCIMLVATRKYMLNVLDRKHVKELRHGRLGQMCLEGMASKLIDEK
jgi:hypothetical protein